MIDVLIYVCINGRYSFRYMIHTHMYICIHMHVYTVTAVQSTKLDVGSRGKRRDFF